MYYGKSVLVHIGLNILTIYTLKTGFSKGLIFEDLWI